METQTYDAVAVHDDVPSEERRVWHSCCLRIDQDMCVFLCTICILFAAMVFCCYQLITLKDCHSQNAYIAVLSSLLGILLPQPSLSKK